MSRLGLGSALRRLADAGEPCVVHGVDGTVVRCVPDPGGADFVEARWARAGSLLLSRDAIAAVQSRG